MNAETRSKVFISYRHDEEAITNVANFVENLGLKATVLDEQANNDLTVIETSKNMETTQSLPLQC